MIALIQRVTSSSVSVNGSVVGEIGQGLMALWGVEQNDTTSVADRLLERVLGYRVFADEEGKMNLSLQDIAGSLLLVPQFTLAADTAKGMRPGFSSAANPQEGARLFEYTVTRARKLYDKVETGRFGADMQVSLVNDGPVTFWLRVAPGK